MEVNLGITTSQIFFSSESGSCHTTGLRLFPYSLVGSRLNFPSWFSLEKVWDPLYKPSTSICVLAMNSDKGADQADKVSIVS